MTDDEITVCPECDSARIESRVGTPYRGYPAESGWRCKTCSAHFDEPATRAREGPSVPTSPATKALLEADPDDFPVDGGSA